MLVLKLEMWPYGSEERAYEIGRAYIANDGSGSAERGDYKVAVCRRGTNEVPREVYPADYPSNAHPKAARTGEVKDYPRLAYNVWRLIARAVLAAFPEETVATKKTIIPTLDTFVVRGLELLANPARAVIGTNQVQIPDTQDGQALKAALEWLDAAKGSD